MESMNSKIKHLLTLIICFGVLQACFDNSQNKQEQTINSDSIISTDTIRNGDSNYTNTIDSFQHETEQEVKPPVPDYYDFQSEVEIFYKSYIEKAYDIKTYRKYYRTIYQNKLDSLIKEYDKKKEVENPFNLNND